MATPHSKQSEFVVRIAKKNSNKRYSVLKFNGTLHVDTGRWATPGTMLRMSREDNRSQAAATEIRQEYGEGSEYGKAAREEARRKKYGHQLRTYQHDNQPWRLSFNDANGREKKYRSIREGGTGEHADYWMFLKSGDEFHAYKVDDWYQFLPCVMHRTLDIEQAEERFLQRNRVMNQFALKAQIQRQLKAMDEEGGEQVLKNTKNLKIKDEASSDDSDSGEENGDNGDSRSSSKKANKKKVKKEPTRKDKKQRVENADDVAAYESEDGEDEGREYDYMSDSGSDSERDEGITMEQKVDEAMVAVGDEEGLKKLIGDDLTDTESSEDEEEEETAKKLLATAEGDEDENKKRFRDIDERDSSGSDSDDPDKEVNSAIFLPAKKTAEDVPDLSVSGKKRAIDESGPSGLEAKRPRLDAPANEGGNGSGSATATAGSSAPDGLNEETVRRYLKRKPHTTKELLSKVKSKCGDMEKSEIVQKLAAILKRIEPHQFKQKQGKKDVLFFSLVTPPP